MIIGITGTLGAGKGTIVEILLEKGFAHYSVRDFLIEEIKKRGMEINRDSMVEVANDLRDKNGSSYIVEQLYERAKKFGGDCVIESIRSVGEAKLIKEKQGVLFGVNADVKKRYERIIKRGSSTDSVSFEKFVEDEKREFENEDETKGNLKKCLELTDFVFENNEGVEELKEKVNSIVSGLKEKDIQEQEKKEKYYRPSWDEYFIKMAALVAERSTCLRHRIGAVIVKDKRVLTTGYNGAVAGAVDCTVLGCVKDEQNLESGMGYETCRAMHAEQNAIVQAAYSGISIQGATLYCTHTPCMICAKMIVNAGIKQVVSYHDFQGDKGAKIFLESLGILVRKIDRPKDKITFKD